MNYSNLLQWISIFFMNLSEFYTHEYVTEANAFTRKRKLDLKDIINYVLVQKGRTNAIEAYDFVKNFKINRKKFRVSRQAIGKKRQYINPIIYFIMNKIFVDKIYENTAGLKKFKGYLLMAVDGTELKLPNSEETAEYKIKIHNLLKKTLARLKMSCIVDSQSQFILDVLIGIKGTSESKLAIKHIKRLKKRGLNLNEMIFIGDRGYNSFELMLQIMKTNSHFVIRLKKNMLLKERLEMRTNDEFKRISMNQKRLKGINNHQILKFMSNKQYINMRITELTLPNGETEILISNLPIEEFNSEDLKEIYGRRWKIETVYDFLKNTLQVENFTGRNLIIIKQDMYASILFYNLANAIKLYTIHKFISKKELKKNYTSSFNFTVGILKIEIHNILLAKTKDDLLSILEDLIHEISKNKIKINRNKRKDNEFINPDESKKFHMNRRFSTL